MDPMKPLAFPLISLVASFLVSLALFALLNPPSAGSRFHASEAPQRSEIDLPGEAQPKPTGLEARLRRPVALVLADHDRWLFVANQRSGTVTTIDTNTLRVVAETEVGGRLSDLTSM